MFSGAEMFFDKSERLYLIASDENSLGAVSLVTLSGAEMFCDQSEW